jgi:ATP-binding cassette subfamily B (MDR/TAP) protein 10
MIIKTMLCSYFTSAILLPIQYINCFTGAVVLLLISSGVSMAVPFCIGKVIDIIYTSSKEGHMKERLTVFCRIMIGVFVIGALANFGRVYLMQISGTSMTR